MLLWSGGRRESPLMALYLLLVSVFIISRRYFHGLFGSGSVCGTLALRFMLV